jgi:hypothetical protein
MTDIAAKVPKPKISRDELRFRVIAGSALVLAAILLFIAFSRADTSQGDQISQTGTSSELVERLTPGRGDEALSQATVEIDLVAGWTGTFIIDGKAIGSGDDGFVERVELGQLVFTPGKGRIVETWAKGSANCVTARVHKLSDPSTTRDVSWCFDVL